MNSHQSTPDTVERVLTDAGYVLTPRGGGLMSYCKDCPDGKDFISITYEGEENNTTGSNPNAQDYSISRESHTTMGYLQSNDEMDLQTALTTAATLMQRGSIGSAGICGETVEDLISVSSYVVYDKHTLGFIIPHSEFPRLGVLASKITDGGTHNPNNGPIPLSADASLRQATPNDFKYFRVHSGGYFDNCRFEDFTDEDAGTDD